MSEFKQKVLEVLLKLQYLFDSTESYKPNTKKGIEYCFKHMFPPIVGPEELLDIIQDLKERGLDISITFDIWNDYPNEPIYLKKYGEEERVPLGLIKSENIKEIKKVIEENIDELKAETKKQLPQEIIENLNIKKEKQKFTSEIKIVGDYLCFGAEEKIPVERGQNLLTKIFLDNAKLFRGGKCFREGHPSRIDELRGAGAYNGISTFRDGLKKLRGKLRKSKWPVVIKNVSTGMYKMEIRYNKKSKKQK